MYLTIALIYAVFLIYVFSQFGSRLLARHALIWWFISTFTLLVLLAPAFFQKLTHFLGVELVSNLVFAGWILFLMFHLLKHSAELAKIHRTFRQMITTEACKEFIATSPTTRSIPEGTIKALIVLPCYNEAASLEEICARLRTLKGSSTLMLDYCFINDGSKDSSEEILQAQAPGHFVSHPLNLGVSAALLTGFQIARRLRFDYVVQCDSDGQHPIEPIPRWVEYAHQNQLDLLIGSRFSKKENFSLSETVRKEHGEGVSSFRKMGSLLIRLALSAWGTGTLITDPTSGLRVYSKKAVLSLLEQMPDEYPEPESIALLSARSMKIDEIRVSMNSRTQGASSLTGLKPFQYMIKVLSALIGLRLRLIFGNLR